MTPSTRSWTTTEAPTSVRPGIAYWNELLADHVMPLAVTSREAACEFSADMEESAMGACRALMLAARQSQRVDHSSKRARVESDADTLMLIHMREGVIDLRSDAGDVRLRRDDAVLLSDSDRFVFEASPNTRTLVLRIQRGWLSRWIPRVSDCAGHRIDGTKGWGRTVSSALHNIEPHQISRWRYPAEDVADQIAGMLSLALVPSKDMGTSKQRTMLTRAMRQLRDRFHEYGLRPADIAADVGISPRYLHLLFAGTGSSFSRTLYDLRLEHAARALARPSFAFRSITEVALANGFGDSGHFARLFRARFACSASEYRIKALAAKF